MWKNCHSSKVNKTLKKRTTKSPTTILTKSTITTNQKPTWKLFLFMLIGKNSSEDMVRLCQQNITELWRKVLNSIFLSATFQVVSGSSACGYIQMTSIILLRNGKVAFLNFCCSHIGFNNLSETLKVPLYIFICWSWRYILSKKIFYIYFLHISLFI